MKNKRIDSFFKVIKGKLAVKMKCINFGCIILAPPTMLVKIRHWSHDTYFQRCEKTTFKIKYSNQVLSRTT